MHCFSLALIRPVLGSSKDGAPHTSWNIWTYSWVLFCGLLWDGIYYGHPRVLMQPFYLLLLFMGYVTWGKLLISLSELTFQISKCTSHPLPCFLLWELETICVQCADCGSYCRNDDSWSWKRVIIMWSSLVWCSSRWTPPENMPVQECKPLTEWTPHIHGLQGHSSA